MTVLRRLTVRYTILLAALIILSGVVTFSIVRERLITDLDATLADTAEIVIQNQPFESTTPYSSKRPGITVNSSDVFYAPGVFVQSWEFVDGAPAIRASSTEASGPFDAPALDDRVACYHTVNINGADMRVYTQPVMQDGQHIGSIQVAGDLGPVNQTTNWLGRGMLLVFGALIAVVGLFSLRFSNRILRPVRDIAGIANSITAANDLKSRLDWDGPTQEMGYLTRVFNQMMDRIEHLFNVQQRFIADISHELRTPLTAIQGNVEIARRYGADTASLEAIAVESRRMNRLVDDMLMLVRADNGGQRFDLYALDLNEVVRAAFEHSLLSAEDRKLDIRFLSKKAICVEGNVDRLKQLVGNLLDNAIHSTPDGGQIVVSLEADDHNAFLRVADTGIGIAPEYLERVFDRFFQVDTARTHQDGTFGLGLSIARWIVEAHGGTITAESHPEQGTVFTVRLPLCHRSEAIRERQSAKFAAGKKRDVKRITNELKIVSVDHKAADDDKTEPRKWTC